MNIILSVRPHKRPGTSGLYGVAYVMNATILAPIFEEALSQLQDPAYEDDSIPPHICETLWVPGAKKEGASTIDAI
eukprot:1780805-Karenia_brevis.AAC.1